MASLTSWISSLVLLTLTFTHPTEAVYPLIEENKACYSDSWTYHGHTHTCVKMSGARKNWTEARDHCKEIQYGQKFGVITHLVKIDDFETFLFLKGEYRDHKNWWLGLYYVPSKDEMRWDGYPEKTPDYLDLFSHSSTVEMPYVSVEDWQWKEDSGKDKFVFACQQRAMELNPVTCEYQVESQRIQVNCTSQNNPMSARCEWTYKISEVDTHFHRWNQVVEVLNEEKKDAADGQVSYTTFCLVTLTAANVKMKDGTLVFKVMMYRQTLTRESSTHPDALERERVRIKIKLPNKPTFKALTVEENSQAGYPRAFTENQKVTLTCEIDSGVPRVHSLTLSCDFPITESREKQLKVRGTSFVLNMTVSRDWLCRRCTCIGNHVSGPIESLPLTFGVTDTRCQASGSDSSTSSGLSTLTVIALVLASNIAVIVLAIVVFRIAFRKQRRLERAPRNTARESRGGSAWGRAKTQAQAQATTTVIYKREAKPAIEVRGPDDDNLRVAPQQQTKPYSNRKLPPVGGCECQRAQMTEDASYTTIKEAEDQKRASRGMRRKAPGADHDTETYETLHADDKNYNNLNREPSREYGSLDPGAGLDPAAGITDRAAGHSCSSPPDHDDDNLDSAPVENI